MTRKLLAIAFVLAAPAMAHAQTIDFQDIPSGGCYSHGPTATSRGYAFAGAGDGLFSCDGGVLQHNTSAALIDANGRSVLTMMQLGGGPFSLNSFYAGGRTAEFDPEGPTTAYTPATGIDIVGTLFGGGTVSTSIFLDAVAPYDWAQYFMPADFANLQSVVFTAQGDGTRPEFLIDDIVVNAQTVTPEPATLGLLATELVGVFGIARRRRAGQARSRSKSH